MLNFPFVPRAPSIKGKINHKRQVYRKITIGQDELWNGYHRLQRSLIIVYLGVGICRKKDVVVTYLAQIGS